MSLTQDVDQIISDENITNENLATEEPKTDDVQSTSESEEGNGSTAGDGTDNGDTTEENKQESGEDNGGSASEAEDGKQTDGAGDEAKETKSTSELDTKSPTETVQEAKSFLQNLNLGDDKIFDESGNVKPFTDVIPAGAYLASQLTPVKVIDKDGKEHEFLLLSDVKEKFPDGFEAKNNIEQMEFQNAILANETTFKEAVKTYESAKEQYTKETSDLVQSRGENERIGKEYRAMADAGLVPKIEGDANDPKFLESPAVKELNSLLEYMDTKNKELSTKGLGQINSLYVAKMFRDQDAEIEKKDDKKQEIINERQEVASLTANPTPNTGDKGKKSYSNVPLSRLADEIIASEGLK